MLNKIIIVVGVFVSLLTGLISHTITRYCFKSQFLSQQKLLQRTYCLRFIKTFNKMLWLYDIIFINIQTKIHCGLIKSCQLKITLILDKTCCGVTAKLGGGFTNFYTSIFSFRIIRCIFFTLFFNSPSVY